ncbi:hypothetical protein LEL_10393 [Akanthomyces lecanii RCEF 1005]|uniref:Uncharacterized protein n=1 Tax=Akanthomyces lecanii RCEF 1005 TaxID=1081108 RepID=A0A167ZPT8_CORDF|nr:hypothetical protein LEL_10393 [Akanthomyces lecanii RCEF 1005]
MKAAAVLAVALSGVAFAAPEIYATDKSEPFKDLSNLKYNNNLPIADAAADIERREVSEPVKDNRNLHYNTNNKMPIAMTKRNLHYNAANKMPIAMASPERREVPVERRKASKPIKDNRNLHYNANNKMPIAESD